MNREPIPKIHSVPMSVPVNARAPEAAPDAPEPLDAPAPLDALDAPDASDAPEGEDGDEVGVEGTVVGGTVVGEVEVTVIGTVAVVPLASPIAVIVWAPAAVPAGMATDLENPPLEFALVVPRSTGVLWSEKSIVSAAWKPLPESATVHPVAAGHLEVVVVIVPFLAAAEAYGAELPATKAGKVVVAVATTARAPPATNIPIPRARGVRRERCRRRWRCAPPNPSVEMNRRTIPPDPDSKSAQRVASSL
jgi:hypothetical protein